MNNSSDVNQNVVKDALKITNILNKHLLEECVHCRKLFEDAFRNEN